MVTRAEIVPLRGHCHCSVITCVSPDITATRLHFYFSSLSLGRPENFVKTAKIIGYYGVLRGIGELLEVLTLRFPKKK